MNQTKAYPDWFLWIWEKGALVLFGGGLLVVSMFVFSAVYLDRRLDQVEKRIGYVPARSYEAPNLDDFAVRDAEAVQLTSKHLVYVPAYSHVYYEGGAPCLMEITLSVRNIDPAESIYLDSVQYFDTTGTLVKTHLDQLIQLKPLQTIEFLVERRDTSGGSGANFLVEWLSETPVNAPLIEAVMVGTVGAKGFSLARTGIEIDQKAKEPNP